MSKKQSQNKECAERFVRDALKLRQIKLSPEEHGRVVEKVLKAIPETTKAKEKQAA